MSGEPYGETGTVREASSTAYPRKSVALVDHLVLIDPDESHASAGPRPGTASAAAPGASKVVSSLFAECRQRAREWTRIGQASTPPYKSGQVRLDRGEAHAVAARGEQAPRRSVR